MTTIRKRLARLWRSVSPKGAAAEIAGKTILAPQTVPEIVTTREVMPLEKAEALVLKNLDRGLKHLARHPRKARAGALFRVAAALLHNWRPEDALRVNSLALACYGRSKYYAQRALIFHAMGNVPEVIANARKAHEVDPLEQRAVRTLATFAPESITSTRAMERIVYASPDPGKTAAKAAVAMFRAGRPAETLRAMKRMLERIDLTPLQRDQIEYYAGVAAEYSSRRVALKFFKAPSPDGSHWALSKALGSSRCLLHLGRPQDARDVIPDTMETYCPARLEANLALGRIGEAYSEYRIRPQALVLANAFPNFLASGSKRLVLTEGGPGDEIRFASMLRESGATSATCDPRLQTLLRRSFPDVEFIPVARTRYEYRKDDLEERRAVPFATLSYFMNDKAITAAHAADSVVGYMDLIGSLRSSRASFPKMPYLTPDPVRVDDWKRYIPDDRPNIAISWRSMLHTIHRSAHYLTAEQLAPMRNVNARIWLFQQGMRLSEYSLLRNIIGAELPPLLDVRDDFEGQAAFLSCMDAVISPYSTTGELAGALGVPTFLMAFTPNTRWRRNSDGTDVWQGSGQVICGTSAQMPIQLVDAVNHRLTHLGNAFPRAPITGADNQIETRLD